MCAPGGTTTFLSRMARRTTAHELRRRALAGVREDRPAAVVEVEHRVGGDQFAVRVVVAVDGADVAPVAVVTLGFTGDVVAAEVVHGGLGLRDQRRDDVAAHVVPGRLVQRVLLQRVDQHVGGEQVVAHGHERLVRRVAQAGRIGRLLQESDHPAVHIGLDNAEVAGLGAWLAQAGHGHPGAGLQVLVHHLARVHPVDVVRAEHRDVGGRLVVHQVEALVDGVGAALVPARAQPLLRGHRRDVLAGQRGQPPCGADVPVQRVRLVLGEHADSTDRAVHQVGQHEVDQPVHPAEGHGRLGPVGGQRHQSLALATGQHNAENVGILVHVDLPQF